MDDSKANAENVTKVTDQDGQETTAKAESASERLLTESKKYKERAQKAERELEEFRKAQLSEQGKFKELYEKVLKEKEALQRSVVEKEISSKVMEAARKAGAQNPDAVMKLGDKDLLKYDQETFDVYGVEEFVESVKKQVPQLFSPSVTSAINPATPSPTKEKILSARDIAKLPFQERVKLMVEMAQKQ